MSHHLTDSRLLDSGADAIHAAFGRYRARFRQITQRAKLRFKNRDWHGMRADAAERLSLYKDVVDQTEASVRQHLGARIGEKRLWTGMKAEYSGMIVLRNDWELAETFFNSITRRIFATVGVDSRIEFVNADFDTPPAETRPKVFRTYQGSTAPVDLIQQILADYPWMASFQDILSDAKMVAAEIEHYLQKNGAPAAIDRIEIAESVFYRGMGAYVIGRIYANSSLIPLAIALLNTRQGIMVDGVLLDEDDVSILFSFTRAYFHVEVERPYDLVHFLKTILPRKRIAELYISIGFNKHGKTELYRELMDHQTVCREDRFDFSQGQRGMVMIVFNMPQDDLVFKLIRDRFGASKKTTRPQVIQKYDLVFRHDRAGRLVDAQSFEHLKFDTCCFSADLLTELKHAAGHTVRFEKDHIIVDHAYVQRRVTPLDVFLKQAAESEARKIVIDWGYAIKDLAVSNIFPGDILTKNFGVTRHGRVVFYDYDELCQLTDCRFRKLPQSTAYEDEVSAEPWFYVDQNDVFPEEFRRFLGLPLPLRKVFSKHHSDLFEVEFWRKTQQTVIAGELPHIFPYARHRRLKREGFQ